MIRMEIANVLSARLAKADRIARAELRGLQRQASRVHRWLQLLHREGELGFFDLPGDSELVKAVKEMAEEVRRRFDHFVVLGIGGSSLGPRALVEALRPEQLGAKGNPRLVFIDNSDPEPVARLSREINLRRCCFNVISKSGSTAETMSAFFHFYQRMSRMAGKKAGRHFTLTTELNQGPLHQLAQQKGMKLLPIPENVGGRYSVLSAVGLLPAAVAGIDTKRLLKGAAAMRRRSRGEQLLRNPAYKLAAIHYLAATKKGKHIAVIMPYADALKGFGEWFCQLWAESLGKRRWEEGKETLVGQTPVRAVGATDQHSQLQLYLDGPRDKIVTLIKVQQFRGDAKVPRVFAGQRKLTHLMGKGMSELIHAEFEATRYFLTREGCPNLTLILDTLSEENLGGLVFLYEVATAFMGGLLSINPFDQSAVEGGKLLTHAMLGRESEEGKALLKDFRKYEAQRKKDER